MTLGEWSVLPVAVAQSLAVGVSHSQISDSPVSV